VAPPTVGKLAGLLERRLDNQAAVQTRLDGLLYSLRRNPTNVALIDEAREASEALAMVTADVSRLQISVRLAAITARDPDELALADIS
jgi:hypothetical protein